MNEIITGKDLHEDNRVYLKLPTRLIAKVFVFRLIYGGSAYAYSVDPDFAEVGFSERKWQGVIDDYYRKYQGLQRYHTNIVQEATTTGKVRIPTGRCFKYSPTRRSGIMVWPRTQILNYPVQGLGADLLCFARVKARSLLQSNSRVRTTKLKTTVHDSIVADARPAVLKESAKLISQAISEVPRMFENLYKIPFNLPMTSEIKVGPNLADMELLTDF